MPEAAATRQPHDWGRNPSAAEFGRFGMLHVRHGKAVRGQPPRHRDVASVMGCAGAHRQSRGAPSRPVYR